MFGHLSGTKAGQTEAQEQYSETFGFGGSVSGGGGTITSGGPSADVTLSPDYKPSVGFQPSTFFRPRNIYTLPPTGCDLVEPVIIPANIQLRGDEDPAGVAMMLPTSIQRKFGQAYQNWTRAFPHAPPPIYVLGTYGNDPKHFQWVLALTRPDTPWDPILDSHPALRTHQGQWKSAEEQAQAKIFQAGFRLFFPDWVLDPHNGQNFTAAWTGTMTIDGPFPYWIKFVTEDMVQYAVKVLQHFPDVFVPGRKDTAQGAGSIFFDTFKNGLQAGMLSRQVIGISTMGMDVAGKALKAVPYVAAAAAVATLIIEGFSALFGDHTSPPDWLIALLKMKQLRGDHTGEIDPKTGNPIWAPTFGEVYGERVKNDAYQCKIAAINPPKGAKYTVSEGYLRVMKCLAGECDKWKMWALIALGVGAGYYLLSD